MALTILILAPIGICLGMPMPLGLSRFAALYPRSVAYAWGVNGIASVLASVLGVVVAINVGYAAATLVAAGCYVLAGVHAAIGRWAGRGNDPEVVETEPASRAPSMENSLRP